MAAIVGALLSVAGGLASTILGQISASKKMKQAREELGRQERDLSTWYWNTKGDKLERADMQELARITKENVLERNATAENPIAQNTEEGKAAAREQNGKDITNTARTITSTLATEDAANDKAYLAGKKEISNARMNMDVKNAEQVTKATSDLTNSMINSAGKFVGLMGKKGGDSQGEPANTTEGGSGGSGGNGENGSGGSGGSGVGTRAGVIGNGEGGGNVLEVKPNVDLTGNTRGGLGGTLNKMQMNNGNVYDKQWTSLFDPNGWKNN